MASEDVIELGSSDDETEPAPKKSKPMPNAMVCIPRTLHEVTIKPAKLNLALANKGKGKGAPLGAPRGTPTPKGISTPKGITVSRVPNIKANPFASRSKTNGRPVQKAITKPQHTHKLVKPITIQKPSNSNVTFPQIPVSPKLGNVSTFLKNPIKINSTNSISNLPPSITVKRTTQVSNKPIIFMKSTSIVRSKIIPKQANEVPTVELDDDEGPPPSSGPAWYLRPEEQPDCSEGNTTAEHENNKEPESPKMIEITIEDSPIKPVQNKRTCEVGAELAITIEDSPVKSTADKNASLSDSDDETGSSKEPYSKKKLEYPKDAEKQSKETMEIEIEIPPLVSPGNDTAITEKEVEKPPETSIKKNESTERSTQKATNVIAGKENKTETASSIKSEFHLVYQSFIDLCFQLENSDDMKKIVEKKIEGYYRQVPKEYTESEEFVDMVASKIHAMKASPEKMYLYIKDIVDELNMHRKLAKAQIVNKEVPKVEEPEQSFYREESEYDSKRQRQIRKLEKTIKKLHRAIQKLEEQEVDFDDEDDSVYLLTERYKERMVRVYAKFCQLTNTKMPSEPRIIIDARPGQPSGPAKRLEKWINKKVPIGTPLPFPDFHDVLRCVREANDEDKLFLNEADIMEEARDLFVRCGKKLQRRRQENEWRLAASRIALEVDPAEQNEQLKCKLDENKKIAANKETEIFNKYADRQNQLKLEAVEIGDKEAEESPVESEEEEANDESVSLGNKEKRKERLKRLLHDKSRRASEGKENQLSQASKTDEISEADTKMTETNEEATVKVETDIKENKEGSETLEKSDNQDNKSPDPPETLSVSDDSNDLESDIDELHLLQKLHSGNEAHSSTLESSDSDSPIAISDSLESGSDSKKQLSDDVISIENSSYSESEVDKIDKPFKKTDSIELIDEDNRIENIVHAGMETQSSNVDEKIDNAVGTIQTDSSDAVIKIDNSNAVIDTPDTNTVLVITNTEGIASGTEKVLSKSNNDEYNEFVENILLASSDEENGNSQESVPSANSVCINLRDDLISIDETVVGTVVDESKKELNVLEEINVEKPSETAINANEVVLENNHKNEEKLNSMTAMDTPQNEALSASRKESAQSNGSVVPSDATELDDTDVNMDIDQDETVKQSESKPVEEENVPLTLTPETQ